jgi:hypothetical protein
MGLGFVKYGVISQKKRIFWETQLFATIRSWKEGITFFRFKLNLDTYISEHTPSFQIELTIFNVYSHLWIYQNNFEEENDVPDDILD